MIVWRLGGKEFPEPLDVVAERLGRRLRMQVCPLQGTESRRFHRQRDRDQSDSPRSRRPHQRSYSLFAYLFYSFIITLISVLFSVDIFPAETVSLPSNPIIKFYLLKTHHI